MSTTAAAPSGVDQLQQRLNDPNVIDGLNRLLDHLDTVSFVVESTDGFIRRSEVIAESLSDGVGELRGHNSEQALEFLQKAPQILKTGTQLADAATGLNVDELTRSKVLERLTEPQTLAMLNQLFDKLPLIAFMLDSVEELIARSETIADSVTAAVNELKAGEQKIDLSKVRQMVDALPKMAAAGEKLLDSDLMGERFAKVIDAGVSMVDSGMMDEDVLRTLGDLGTKSIATYHEVASKPVTPVGGLFATLKAAKDPDVQKSVGFFFAFAKAFAKHLK